MSLHCFTEPSNFFFFFSLPSRFSFLSCAEVGVCVGELVIGWSAILLDRGVRIRSEWGSLELTVSTGCLKGRKKLLVLTVMGGVCVWNLLMLLLMCVCDTGTRLGRRVDHTAGGFLFSLAPAAFGI